jgi:hypothetical protein
MGFLNGLLKLGTGALNVSAKVACGTANVVGKTAGWAGKKTAKLGKKALDSRVFLKNASPKKAENLTFIDKKFQEATGIAKKGADGAMQYKTLAGGGIAVAVGLPMLGTTGRVISGSAGQSSRGMVSVADNMERFVSYDGSGFINNVDDVAGGDLTVLNDIVNHTFTSQRSMINDNSLNDKVFALHANREG